MSVKQILTTLVVFLNSIKQVLAPLFVFIADEAHQLPGGMQSEGTRAPGQRNPSFFGSAVALAVIALIAAGHQILPRGPPAAGSRHDVIQSQLRSRKRATAELASIAVSQKYIFPRKSPRLLRDMAVSE